MNASQYRIDCPGSSLSGATARFAAQEAQRYLARMLPQGGMNVELRICENAQLRYDGFRVLWRDGTATIESRVERGLLFGVYSLLEKLGCRFLFPRPEWEVVPHLSALPALEAEWTEQPILEFRGLCLYGVHAGTEAVTLQTIDWMAKNRFNLLLAAENRPCDAVQGAHAILYGEVTERITPELKKRGMLLDMSEHSTDYFFPRDSLFPSHPEWFSLIDGERRPYQMCYANEAAVAYYAGQYARYAEEHPEIDMIGVWPLDGGGYCQCEACAQPHTIAKAICKVAQAIREVRPDLAVEYLAYTPQSFPVPDFPMDENMCALVCRRTDALAREWAVKMADTCGAFSFEYNSGDHYCWRANPWIHPAYFRSAVNTIAALGYRGIVSLYLPITAWWQASINLHFMRLAAWNPAFDIAAETAALAKDLFGPQAAKGEAAMHALFEQAQAPEMWQRAPFRCLSSFEVDFYRARNQALDQIHGQAVQRATQRALDILNAMPLHQMDAFARMQHACFSAYAKLQGLYHALVDCYDGDRDALDGRLEPLFAHLQALQEQLGDAFITPEYAKWRLLGRDRDVFDQR